MATKIFAESTDFLLHGFWGKAFRWGGFRSHIEWHLDEVIALALALLYLLPCTSLSSVVVGPWVFPYLMEME